jgi:DNA-binding NtrC family response regulator
MIVLVQANVLTVGLNGENEALRELPVHLIETYSAAQAARFLKNEKVDVVICKWNLVDSADGLFLKRLKIIKPQIKTIVIIKAGNITEEISARSCGASAVLTDCAGDELLRGTVIEALKLKEYIWSNGAPKTRLGRLGNPLT